MADTDPSSAPAAGPSSVVPETPDPAETRPDTPRDPYETACDIHDHLEIMIHLATAASLSGATLESLNRAKAEADRVIRRQREPGGSPLKRQH